QRLSHLGAELVEFHAIRRRKDGQNHFFARPQNDALGKLFSRDLQSSGCALRGVGGGVRHYRVGDLAFVEKTLQTCGYAHGRTPFAMCIGKIIARRKTKENMYPTSLDLRREQPDSANRLLSYHWT